MENTKGFFKTLKGWFAGSLKHYYRNDKFYGIIDTKFLNERSYIFIIGISRNIEEGIFKLIIKSKFDKNDEEVFIFDDGTEPNRILKLVSGFIDRHQWKPDKSSYSAIKKMFERTFKNNSKTLKEEK